MMIGGAIGLLLLLILILFKPKAADPPAPVKPIPAPTFGQFTELFEEAQNPGNYCCHFYGEKKLNGDVYEACISEKAQTRMLVPTAKLSFFDQFYFYTCGTNVAYELCQEGKEQCYKSESKEALLEKDQLKLYLSVTPGTDEYKEELKVFKPLKE